MEMQVAAQSLRYVLIRSTSLMLLLEGLVCMGPQLPEVKSILRDHSSLCTLLQRLQ